MRSLSILHRQHKSGEKISRKHQHHHGLYLVRGSEPFSPWCRYYADVQQQSSEGEKPAKQAVAIDADELLREAEEQAGDDGKEQVLLSLSFMVWRNSSDRSRLWFRELKSQACMTGD